jgi:hypothetical protein
LVGLVEGLRASYREAVGRLAAFLSAPVLAVGFVLIPASPGAGTVGVAVHIQPAVGGSQTTFVVSFTAPARTGVIGSKRLRDELSVDVMSTTSGCLAQASAAVASTRRGQRIHVRLDPKRFGGRWCAGVFRGRILELQTAVCPPGTLCPTYVRIRTIGRFSLVVHRSAPKGGELSPPSFAGLGKAFACTPGPQRPGQTTPYTLSWKPASDDTTAAAAIVYDVYYATGAGGEDFARPTWTTPPGVTSFRTPGLPSHGSAYFVVRARDAAGNEDGNSHEVAGLDPCL